MSNYYELILDALKENGKAIKDLEEYGILGKNTFYIFKSTAPSLPIVIDIANFLNMSIDYMLNRVEDNYFREYSVIQKGFYENLINVMGNGVSQVKLCKDLGISRTNFSRWKNGTIPTMSKLVSLSNYLNCTIDELLEHK